MIVWLASYPRSGNTLLRTIFQHTMGVHSYSDEMVQRESEFRRNPSLIGHVEWSGDWNTFYSEATASPEPVLVKTHLPPRDRQPFLYVVRDGRSALQSYRKFHQNFNGIDKTFPELILGADAYGDWSSHYEAWNQREGVRGHLLRFDELMEIDVETLAVVSKFIGNKGPIRPWSNPVAHLRQVEPRFFHRRETRFIPDSGWTPAVESFFRALHGSLMMQLGYFRDEKETAEPVSGFSALADDLSTMMTALWKKNLELTDTCKERLDLIERLDGECKRRDAEIERLRKALERRPIS